MPNNLHGSGAFRHTQQCGWCVDDARYKTPPSQHANIFQPPIERASRIEINLRIAQKSDDPVKKRYHISGENVDVIVDSGSEASIFNSQAARAIGISDDDILRGDESDIELADGSTQPCRRYDISIYLGGEYQDIPVVWAIDVGGKKLLDRFPAHGNLLGMAGILKNNKLCLTPEMVYVFPRLR